MPSSPVPPLSFGGSGRTESGSCSGTRMGSVSLKP